MAVDEEAFVTPSQSRARQWVLIIVAIGAFTLALAVGIQVIGVLMGVVSPPKPPIPPSATEQSYTTDARGRDRWVYSATSFPDSVLAFYQAAGAGCTVKPFAPEYEQALRVDFTDASVFEAHCTGTQRFDRFTMRWEVLVSSSPGSTLVRLDVVRQIDWFGSTP